MCDKEIKKTKDLIVSRHGKFAYYKGLDGESIAIEYLKNLGWTILVHREKTPFGEIDLIASKENCLIFIEIKFRKNFTTAIYALGTKQQKRLLASADYFLIHNNKEAYDKTQFDLILINEFGQIKHLENILWD